MKTKNPRNQLAVVLTAFGVASIVVGLRSVGYLQALEWATYDLYFRWRGSKESVYPHILIVGINEKDLRNIEQWPFPDAVLADALQNIKRQDPVVIGLDIYRDLPVEPGHEALVEVFTTTPNLIGIEKVIAEGEEVKVAPSGVLKSLGQVNPNDIVVDADGKLRRGLLFLTNEEEVVPSFGMRLAQIFLEARGITPQPVLNEPDQIALGKGIIKRFETNTGGYVQADDGGYQILLNYRGSACGSESCPFRMVSLTDVLEERVPEDWVRDRVVLIGSTAESLRDFFYTPYSSALFNAPDLTSGVEVQAHVISYLIASALEGRPGIQTWSDELEIAWIGVWAILGASLCWGLRNVGTVAEFFSPWTSISLSFSVCSLVGGTYLAFLGGWWIPVIPPLLAFGGAAMVMTSYIATIEHQDRKMIMNLFGRYVTPAIADTIWKERNQLLSQGRIRSQQMFATVIFTDLQGFSTLTEQMSPSDLIAWLNDYMNAMSELVLNHQGVIDKFIGDAIMAVFGIPVPRMTSADIALDAVRAVECAVAMEATLKTLNSRWLQQGYPTVKMRVGIATGEVITGTLGSSQRLEYTTLGDTVNIAARLESFDKKFMDSDCRILVSEETYKLVQKRFPMKRIGKVQLRGRENFEEIYQYCPNKNK